MSMTKLEKVLAETLAKVTSVDIPAIVEAAQACCCGGGGCGEPAQTVQTTPVTRVETATPEAEKPKRERNRRETPAAQEPPNPETQTPPVPPPQEQKAPETVKPSEAPGVQITGLIEGDGPGRKVVKAVFLAAVEKAVTLAALTALNDICDCGVETSGFTEETAPVLRRRLTRWGMALT